MRYGNLRGGQHVVILDDDVERFTRMRLLLAEAFPDLGIEYFDNAPDLLAALPQVLVNCSMISLDHDLGPVRDREGQRFDPGTGRAVTRSLETIGPSCPVIVHSSNGQAAEGMMNDLRFSGWEASRVVPFDDLDWIESSWLPTVQSLLLPS